MNQATGATLAEMRTDIQALPGLRAAAISEMQQILAEAGQKDVRIVPVRPASFFISGRDPDKDEKQNFNAALGRLREHVYSLLDEGVKVIWE